MGDQQRWFKLWHSSLADPDLSALSGADRWAWAALGVYTKVHGTHGVLRIHPKSRVLAYSMGVEPDELPDTLLRLPSIYLGTHPVRWPHGHDKPPVCEGQFVRGGDPLIVRGSSPLEEWCTRHGKITVTWKNWGKYQEDSTQAERQRASRSKKRGEEKRILPPLLSNPPPSNGFAEWPEEWHPIRDLVLKHPWLEPYRDWLCDLAWWQAEDERLSGSPKRLDELLASAVAYCITKGYKPTSRVGLRSKLHNCMGFEAERSQREGQRQAIDKR